MRIGFSTGFGGSGSKADTISFLPQMFVIPENYIDGTSVGTIVATGGKPVSFTVAQGHDEGSFNINASTGVITIVVDENNPVLDFDNPTGENSYNRDENGDIIMNGSIPEMVEGPGNAHVLLVTATSGRQSVTQTIIVCITDEFDVADLSTKLVGYANGQLQDTIGNNHATILTPVINIASNSDGYMPRDGHAMGTDSFAMEVFLNITGGSVLYHYNSGTSTGTPGYALRTANLYISSNVSMLYQSAHNLNIVDQGWIHCFIVVNRIGYLDAYRNGVRVLHVDISAKAGESITPGTLPNYFTIAGANNFIGKLGYLRFYKFPTGVPADIATYLVSNYNSFNIDANLLPFISHSYVPLSVPSDSTTGRLYDMASDSPNWGGISNATTVWDKGSMHEVKYGNAMYWSEDLGNAGVGVAKYYPLLINGVNRTAGMSTLNSGYVWIRNNVADGTNLNVGNFKLRFVDNFFDRSNATIWGADARTGYYDAADPKAFHSTELNQRIIYNWLNPGYQGRFAIKMQSTDYRGSYSGSVEEIERRKLLEVLYYSVNKTLADHEAIMNYTGDSFAAVRDESNAIVFDSNNQVEIGRWASSEGSLCMRFDDGLIQQYTDFFPLLSSYNVPGTVLAVSQSLQTGHPLFMTVAEMQELEAVGWEIITHAKWTNDDMRDDTPEDTITQIDDATTFLRANFANVVNWIFHMSGQFNFFGRFYALTKYRTTAGNTGGPYNGKANPKVMSKMVAYDVEAKRTDTATNIYTTEGMINFKKIMDTAKLEGRILILFEHNYVNEGGYEVYDEVFSYAQSIGLTCRTINDALNTCKYISDKPTFISQANVNADQLQFDAGITRTSTTCTFAITGGADAALFTIDAVTGQRSFRLVPVFAAPIDSDSNGVYEIEVTATSKSGKPATQTIHITVANTNGLDIDATAYINKMSVAPDSIRQGVIHETFRRLKATEGLWQQIEEFGFMAAHNEATGLLKAKKVFGTLDSLTKSGSLTFTTDRGFVPISTAYIDTDYDPALNAVKFLQNSASIGVYIRENSQSGKAQITKYGGETTLYSRYNTATVFRLNQSSSTSHTESDSRGFSIVNRVSSTIVSIFRNKTKTNYTVTSSAIWAQASTTSNFKLLDGGNAPQVSFWYFGGGLTDVQENALEDAINYYLTQIGANI